MANQGFSRYSGYNFTAYVNVSAGSHSFKIDTSAAGNWSSNFGDNNLGDACLDSFGANIPFNQGAGTYLIRYSTGIPGGVGNCSGATYYAQKIDSYATQQRSMFVRGSFSQWLNLPMYPVRNNIWETTIYADANTFHQFKFDSKGDWSLNFGRPLGSDPRGYVNSGTAIVTGDNLSLYLEDYSGRPQVERILRFNDLTLEYSLCLSATRPICQ